MARELFRITNKAKDALEIDIDGTIGDGWFDDESASNTKTAVQKLIKEVAQSKASVITVNINSYGGDVNHGISIHDMLAEHKAKVITNVHGHTASAATIIAQAGDERRISDNALFLIHRASTITWGNIKQIQASVSDLEKVDQTLSNIYAKRTGKKVDEIIEIMDRFNGDGEWLTAQEAKDLGLVDTIYEPMKAAAMVGSRDLKAFGLPELPKEKIKEQPVNQSIMKTTLKAAWAAVIAFLGVKPEEAENTEVTAEMVEKLNGELQARADRIAALEGELGTSGTDKEKAVQDMAAANQQIAALTTERDGLKTTNAALQSDLDKAKGKKTETETKEDPPVDNATPKSIISGKDKDAESLRKA